MKKLLISGAAGFIGHHFLEHFLENTDWEIIALVRMSRAGDLNRIDYIFGLHPEWKSRVNVVWHDLRDPLNSAHKHIGQVDYILHLAADSHVDDSLKRRKEVFLNNTISTVNMLEYAITHQKNLKRFVYYSTDEVFGTAYGEYKFKEDDRLNPQNPYSAGKASGEMACLAWKETTGLPLTIFRTMNMFGERQDPEKMVPKTIGRYLKGLPAIIHAFDGQYGERYWLHAKNSADSVLFLLKNNLDLLRVNIAGQTELNNYAIAHKIADIMGIEFKHEVVDALQVRPGYDRKYSVDSSLIESYGWKYPIPFEESLEQTVKWTMDNPQWVEQIDI